jgi:hypothetical protein
MKQKRIIIGVLLLAVLAGCLGGFWLRYHNETRNQTVVTVVDYREFSKTANFANQSLDQILDDLHSAGVKNIAVKETTVRDLEERGDIGLYSYAEFSALTKSYGSDIWPSIQQEIEGKSINPSNRVLVSSDLKTTQFLRQRLERRFNQQELIQFSVGGQDYFILKTMLIPQPRTGANKMENLPPIFDARLGFDESILDELSKQGFQIVLMPGQNRGSNTKYLEEYRDLVQKYNVKILIFDGGQLPGYPKHLSYLQKLVQDEDLTLGIFETSVQLGYMEQKGLDEIMEVTSYPINRVYSTRNDEFLDDVNERYYRWVRAVVDRGIRIMYVVPFNDQKLSFTENLDKTMEKLDAFHQTIGSKGFTLGNNTRPLSSQVPGVFHWMMIALSLWLVGYLYLVYLLKIPPKVKYLILIAGAILALLVGLKGGVALAQLYALAAAIIYPTLASLIWIIYLRNYRVEHGTVRQIITSLVILLGINLLGAFTIVSSLADIRYIMNVELFRGVKLAFLLPLLLFIVNYLVVFSGEEGAIKYTAGWMRRSPSYLALFLAFMVVVALYYYVGRSGHTGGVGVSSLELRLREVLETIFMARPRFKEILIGYPAIFALVYLYRRYPIKELVLILGLGAMMGTISTVNSFSHVFTAITISANRTLAGLLVGIVIGLATLLGIWILEKIWKKWVHPAIESS